MTKSQSSIPGSKKFGLQKDTFPPEITGIEESGAGSDSPPTRRLAIIVLQKKNRSVKKMVELDLGRYLTPVEVGTSGRQATILAEGEHVKKVYKDKEKKQLQLPIKVDELGERVWTANKTAQLSLAKAWGNNTLTWVGKRIKLSTVKVNVSGEIKDSIYAEPIVAAVETVK